MTATKTLRGNTTIWAVRPEVFTAAEWAAGTSAAKWATAITAGLIVDISCAVEDGYSLNATGSATDSSMSVCDIAEVESPTYKEYEAALSLFRNRPGTIDTPIYDIALSWLDGLDVPLYLVKRVDKAQGIPVAAGHTLSAYSVTTDNGKDAADDGEMLMFDVRFKTPGGIATNIDAIA